MQSHVTARVATEEMGRGQDELPATSPSSSQLQTRLDSSRLHFHVIVKATTIVTTTTTTTTTTMATTTVATTTS